jgi:hypothetical protein
MNGTRLRAGAHQNSSHLYTIFQVGSSGHSLLTSCHSDLESFPPLSWRKAYPPLHSFIPCLVGKILSNFHGIHLTERESFLILSHWDRVKPIKVAGPIPVERHPRLLCG